MALAREEGGIGLYLLWAGTGIGGLDVPVRILYSPLFFLSRTLDRIKALTCASLSIYFKERPYGFVS